MTDNKRASKKSARSAISIGDKDIDLEFWGGKEKVDGICSLGCQE